MKKVSIGASRLRVNTQRVAGLPEACASLDPSTLALLEHETRQLLETLAPNYVRAVVEYARHADNAPSTLTPNNRATYFKRAQAKTKEPRV